MSTRKKFSNYPFILIAFLSFTLLSNSCATSSRQSDLVASALQNALKGTRDYKFLYEKFEAHIQKYNDFKAKLEKDWNDFYFNLSNQQIDRLLLFNKYKNKTSYVSFMDPLSIDQQQTFLAIQNNFETLKKAETGNAELHKLLKTFERLVQEQWRTYEDISSRYHRQQTDADIIFSNLRNQTNRLADSLNQRSFNTQFLSTLRSIDRNLWNLRYRY